MGMGQLYRSHCWELYNLYSWTPQRKERGINRSESKRFVTFSRRTRRKRRCFGGIFHQSQFVFAGRATERKWRCVEKRKGRQKRNQSYSKSDVGEVDKVYKKRKKERKERTKRRHLEGRRWGPGGGTCKLARSGRED